MSGKVLRSSSKIGLSYLGLRKVLLLQLKGQRVGGGRHAHDAVDVLRAEEARLVVLAAELEGHGPAGGLEGMLLLGWPAHPQPVRHLEGVPAAALAVKSRQVMSGTYEEVLKSGQVSTSTCRTACSSTSCRCSPARPQRRTWPGRSAGPSGGRKVREEKDRLGLHVVSRGTLTCLPHLHPTHGKAAINIHTFGQKGSEGGETRQRIGQGTQAQAKEHQVAKEYHRCGVSPCR